MKNQTKKNIGIIDKEIHKVTVAIVKKKKKEKERRKKFANGCTYVMISIYLKQEKKKKHRKHHEVRRGREKCLHSTFRHNIRRKTFTKKTGSNTENEN